MNVRFFDPGKAYKKIRKEMMKEIDRVLSNGDLILRDDVEIFEKKIADFVGTKYAVGLNSCTDALYLALKALGIGYKVIGTTEDGDEIIRRDEVLVPSRTFVASAQVVVQVGAKPVFYDLDGRLDVSEKTKAIIPVHIEGAFDTNMDTVLAIAQDLNIPVIEDAAQALGAETMGKRAGAWGIAGCFSFYPAKILGAYGDAGALVTDDEKIYNYVKECRNHFKNDASDWGVNSRLDNLQAAVLNVKMKYLVDALDRRKEIAEMYMIGLRGLGAVTLPTHTEGRVWQDYIIRTKNRDGLFDFLKMKGVQTMKNNYPFPVPKLPLAQDYEDETLRLPCNEFLTDKEVNYVISQVKQYYVPSL